MEQEKNEVQVAKEVEVIETNNNNSSSQPKQKNTIIYGIISLACLTVILQMLLIISGNSNIFHAITGLGLSIVCFIAFSANIVIATLGLRAGVINKHKPTIVMCAIALGISVFSDIITVSAFFSCINNMMGA